ncbi:MAG: hypothetical protein L0287_00470 [Anaerolineae bacterium]|nr:hypothetical protein [Anaerolineae bacterium]
MSVELVKLSAGVWLLLGLLIGVFVYVLDTACASELKKKWTKPLMVL